MDRREFLTATRKPTSVSHNAVSTVFKQSVAGLNPYTGTFGTAELVHLLKRTMFGAAKADMDYFKSKSLSAIVNELLHPTSPLPSPPVKEYDSTGALVPDPTIAPGTTWVNDPNTDGTITSRRRASFKKWWTGVMINQDRSIREKMTLFWHNHFSTETADVGDSQFIYKHHNLLRISGLGNFKSLVKAVTLDPCMLVYLSGNNSTLTAPNENYGRELQELFTIGKENTPNYTEDDVKAAARVLTGWRTNSATIASYYDNTRHDKNNKVFSSFYNKTITTRNTTTAGDLEIDDLLTMIFNKKAEVSKFIVKKIYRWFCYYTIDADTEANIILPLAQVFQDNNWEIVPVLSALFNSEHFFDARNRGCLIKSPVDMVTGMCREFNMVFPDVTASSTYGVAYTMYEYVRNYTATMGQSIGDPPNVAGWSPYYQEPQFHEIWLNTDTLPKRNKFSDLFIANGYSTGGLTLKIDPVLFAKNLPNPGDPNKLINDSLDIIFSVPLSDDSKASIKKQILLTGQINDQYWTDAWIAYLANPLITGVAYKTVLSRLQTLYKYFMELAEYQLS